MKHKPIYVLGGSQTDFARNWAREGLELFDMFADALREAVDNAGIQPEEIEVGHVGNFVGELFARQGLIGGFFGQVYPELASLPTARHEAACASGSIAVLSAMRDIEAGHYEMACVLGLELMRNVDGHTGAEYLGTAAWQGHEATKDDCDFPWPHMFDRLTDEYDRRYGINSDHLNRIAEINFTNARSNPRAQTRQWQFPDGAFYIGCGVESRDRGPGEKAGLRADPLMAPRVSSWRVRPRQKNTQPDKVSRSQTSRVSRAGGTAAHRYSWKPSSR